MRMEFHEMRLIFSSDLLNLTLNARQVVNIIKC